MEERCRNTWIPIDSISVEVGDPWNGYLNLDTSRDSSAACRWIAVQRSNFVDGYTHKTGRCPQGWRVSLLASEGEPFH